MPPANRPPPSQSLTDIVPERGRAPAPQRSDRPHHAIGAGSRTRFLSVKRFRPGRVGKLLAIGAAVVVLGFLTWAAIHIWG